MIWHIFRKDWKLQWKFAAMIALLQFATAAVLIKLGPIVDNPSLQTLWQLLTLATMVGIPFLIAAVVHQDAIPGARQDWLIRPIRRSDLLLAKFLFVLLAVHGPMLLADLIRGLAGGFSIRSSLAAAVSRGLFVLLSFSVPLFAFASLTKNAMEAIAGALIVFLSFAGFEMLVDQTLAGRMVVGSGGLSWIDGAAMTLAGLAGAAAVLSVQYFRRRTILARGLAAGAALLAMLCLFLPWNLAFAIQQRISPNPGAASAVAAYFDPEMGRFPFYRGSNGDSVNVYLPLRFGNLPADSALISDRAEIWLRDASGASTRVGSRSGVSVRQETGVGKPAAYLQVNVPDDLYQRLQDQLGQLEIDLSLTLFRSAGSHAIPALNGRARFPELGGCVTRINAAETAVRVGCVPLEEMPACAGLRLEHIPSGQVNPPQFQCQAGSYAPYFDALLVTPPPTRNVPFRDLSGLAKFPVDGSQLDQSQIVIETYKEVDHFQRTVVIPSTRLKDWTAERARQVGPPPRAFDR
jgi:hypothetical protein